MRVKVSSIINNQLPNYVKEEFPLAQEFLSQYYRANENPGGPFDLIQNIDQYIKIDYLTSLKEQTTLVLDVDLFATTITVESTAGFPDSYGLIQINDEIITYTSKTSVTFEGCIRGFSGITNYGKELEFSQSQTSQHSSGSIVKNLSSLLFKEFIKKLKIKVTPGFEGRELFSGINEATFIKQAKDFYSSKGTIQSFEILFRALYGENVDVIFPRDYLISASDADYRITKNLVIEAIEGEPENLINLTIFQDSASAFGTVNKVEKIIRGEKTFYVLSIDNDQSQNGSNPGEFKVTPITRTINETLVNSDFIDVESTVGFSQSGSFTVRLPNTSVLTVSYSDKTLNQFINCSGINQPIPIHSELIVSDYGYGVYKDQTITFRITSILSKFNLPQETKFLDKKDPIILKSFGKEQEGVVANQWHFNIINEFLVDSVELKDVSDFSYNIKTKTQHNFNIGDSVSLIKTNSTEISSKVVGIVDKNNFIIQGQGQIEINFVDIVRRNLTKTQSTSYSSVQKYNSNIQNVYCDSENNVYVSSPSLPSYLNTPISSRDENVVFSGTFIGYDLNIGPHRFLTGDLIFYSGDVITNKEYYVKVISPNIIRLSHSLNDIYNENWVYVDGIIQGASIRRSSFVNKTLDHQRLLRKISSPLNSSSLIETKPGNIGIFVNGVELTNYKSSDQIYYGGIEEVVVTSGGSDYDVLQPPVVSITDNNGSGAEALASIKGSFERIDIIDPGFDYLEEPVITITGGNGSGAIIRAKLVQFNHEVSFDSTSINVSTDVIGFSTYHKFRDFEQVVYDTQNQRGITGLTTSSTYFVSVQDEFNIKLLSSITSEPIGISSIGRGIHKLKSTAKKNKIGSIFIINPGENYTNRKIVVSSSGISTQHDTIKFNQHGFRTGEIINYSSTGSVVTPLSSNVDYYVTTVDENTFKLSLNNENLDRRVYLNLSSSGSGEHSFFYPEIKVNVSGKVGISTIYQADFNAVLQPIVRGSVDSIIVTNKGSNYGTQEIINYKHQPQILLSSGSGAIVTPIIVDGKIQSVVVNNFGSNYNSPPTLKINGSGFGAILTPIVEDGLLIEVKVIYGGGGYGNDTNIDVISAGSGASFESVLEKWTINLVEKQFYQNNINPDDGYIFNGLNDDFGLQFNHLFPARKLRQQVITKRNQNGQEIFVPDLIFSQNKEQNSITHSPILGWAYDGNPIYGPYGYDNPKGGNIKQLKSGYTLKEFSTRPNLNLYPLGFFVEDYVFTNSGDLDEHNGRFCVTPDFPNGTYAYFATFEATVSNSFQNYKKPFFPYTIGNYFKSQVIEFNFTKRSNQRDINLNETNWIKNVKPYGKPFIGNKIAEVKSITSGSIDSVGIITSGDFYKVNDKIIFDNEFTGGRNVSAFVDFIKGKEVTNVGIAVSSYEDIEFLPFNNTFIGFTTVPHGLKNNDIVTITTDYNRSTNEKIKINQNTLYLTSGIGSASQTGLTTYFNVVGTLIFPTIRENDIYTIGSEQIKVLAIEPESSRIRVLRNQNGTVGITSYSSGQTLIENTKKFTSNLAITTSFNNNINQEKYFNPSESLGLGVGTTFTLYFSNPGIGKTTLTINTKSIYIPNHNLETGDLLEYSSNGGTSIQVSTNGVDNFNLSDGAKVYAAKLTENTVGISTFRVGLGSTGTFVGIGSTPVDLLYFTGVGSGKNHSFKTIKDNVLTGSLNRTKITLTTNGAHSLGLSDSVVIRAKSGITTEINISYNNQYQRLIANPKPVASVDLIKNTFRINSHNYTTGRKVLYVSTSPFGGLQNNEFYYVVVVDKDTFKLSNTLYNTSLDNPICIEITGSGTGIFYEVNPPLKVIKNQDIVFNLSDSSLSYLQNGSPTTAFDLRFFKDPLFTQEFDSAFLNATQVGSVGISTNAKVTLKVTDEFPDVIYYNLSLVNTQNNPKILTVDTEQLNFNKIQVVESIYNGEKVVTDVTTNSFSFILNEQPDQSNNLEYFTNSTKVSGQIHSIKINNSGNSYKKLPKVSRIDTVNGSNALVNLNSTNIGKVNEIEILDFGYDYYSDYTNRPIGKLPEIVTVDVLNSLDYVGISSFGFNYSSPPNLVLVDEFTKTPLLDAKLNYISGSNFVEIEKNVNNIYGITPKIIPINNTNGIRINNIVYNQNTKDVVVTLGSSFSNLEDFPFTIGDKILIENVSVGINTTGKGYNSKQYNYQLFTVKNTDPNIGGIGATVSYSLEEFLTNSEFPGNFDIQNSSGRIIPEKYFPIFDIKLKPNQFLVGEPVTFNGNFGYVQNWNPDSGQLKIVTTSELNPNDIILGETSQSIAVVKTSQRFESDFIIFSNCITKTGWQNETGFLNNNFQRVHDSNYYQYFSYDLRSRVSYDQWENAVQKLSHTAGFKKFGNLIIESEVSNLGISTEQNEGTFESIADLSSSVSLNCTYDFDLARENNVYIDNQVLSNEIIFNSAILQDYIESFGNRVLVIDDISSQFNSTRRADVFESVDVFDVENNNFRKYLIYVQDKLYSNEIELTTVNLIQNGSIGFLNQYAKLSSFNDLGYFDFNVTFGNGNLLFYPIKNAINDYNVATAVINVDTSVVGVGSTQLGDTVHFETYQTNVSSGQINPVIIAGISTDYTSTKALVSISSTDKTYFETNEITFTHDETEIYFIEYGGFNNTSLSSLYSIGIGTFGLEYSGSNINLFVKPNQTLTKDYTVDVFTVSIANTFSTGIGTIRIDNTEISSHVTQIGSTTTPTQNIISTYSSEFGSSYYLISIEDTTNNKKRVSEVSAITFNGSTAFVEYGIVETQSSLGEIGIGLTTNNQTALYFTPEPNIDVEVRVFQQSLGLITIEPTEIVEMGSVDITSSYGDYIGYENSLMKSFELTHKQRPIFTRTFDGSDTNVVDVTANTIRIPEHFFVSGEKITYVTTGTEVGIATTTITGIGTTTLLPSEAYIIKVDDLNIKLAGSAEDALAIPPIPLDLTSVGVGTNHRFISNNQNARVLITIDNVIQSPLSNSPITSNLVEYLNSFDSTVYVSGISSFVGGDFVKVDEEIMRINSVGVASTNALVVSRGIFGSGVSTHSSSSIITKVSGNFNIIDNTIYFQQAPYGISTSTGYTNIEERSTFNGRAFIRSGVSNGSTDTYSTNYIFDDISNNFIEMSDFYEIKNNYSSVTGVATDNSITLINGIFQVPGMTEDYYLQQNAGITTITFTGNSYVNTSDINTANIPRGGMIVSVGSSSGLGLQPLVSAGGTAVVSVAGTISSVSIGNSGSGYRSGIQTTVNVGVTTDSLLITNVGIASVSNGHIISINITNPGTGYTSTNPPKVVIDPPLYYTDIPLIYSSTSSGIGTGAVVDVVVGQGSSVISFNLKNSGISYKKGDVLTVAIGGTTGIQTNTGSSYEEFTLTVDEIYNDSFNSWSIGNLLLLDSIDNLFDGITKTFPIIVNGNRTSFRAKKGSNIDVQAALLVFLNDVLQVPGEGYTFKGGSTITFSEAPKIGDTATLIFYRGTGDIDTKTVDVLETIKRGDRLTLNDDNIFYQQDSRLVDEVISTDLVESLIYSGPGISSDSTLERPVLWCKQTDDLFIGGESVSKERVIYESLIQPTTHLIRSVGLTTDLIFVESVKTFFDNASEYSQNGTDNKPQQKIILISQDSITSVSATAIVSTAGTISSINIEENGYGYNFTPSVSISNPIGFGTTNRATATATVSDSSVVSISIVEPGLGYTSTNPPQVLVESPKVNTEIIDNVSYSGDFGIISGISTSGVATTAIVVDFFIPLDSPLRNLNENTVGSANTGISGIQTGYYFVIKNSNIGVGLTSIDNNGSIIGIGTTFIDNVYSVSNVSIATTTVPGVGSTLVSRVTARIMNYNGLSGIGNSGYFGDYSWGVLTGFTRNAPKTFNAYVGIETSTIVQRITPLKPNNYI